MTIRLGPCCVHNQVFSSWQWPRQPDPHCCLDQPQKVGYLECGDPPSGAEAGVARTVCSSLDRLPGAVNH